MYLEDPAVVISLKWKLTKRLLQGPMLSPVVMPGSLTRNNWKQKKHSKPLKWLSLRSTSEIMEPREAETIKQTAYTIDSHRGAVLDRGLPAKCWKGHLQGLGLNTIVRGRCDRKRGSSEGDRLQSSLCATRWARSGAGLHQT